MPLLEKKSHLLPYYTKLGEEKAPDQNRFWSDVRHERPPSSSDHNTIIKYTNM